jgi:hypothetical protein
VFGVLALESEPVDSGQLNAGLLLFPTWIRRRFKIGHCLLDLAANPRFDGRSHYGVTSTLKKS